MNSSKSKNKQFVILTLFAMTLVVIGHSDITNDFKDLWIYNWVYSFHMPLFFFISGSLFALTMTQDRMKQTPFIEFIKKKAIRLLIPFIFINTIIFSIKAFVIRDSSLMQNPIEPTLESLLDATFFHPIGFMWFLPCLFVIFLFSFPLYKYFKIRNLKLGEVILFIVIIVFSIFNNFLPIIDLMRFSPAIHFISYFLLGIIYYEYKSQVDYLFKKFWFIIIPLFLGISVSLQAGEKIAALSGIIFSVGLALLLEEKCTEQLIKISGYCYLVFLLSYFPQMLIRGPISHLYTEINQYVFSALSFIFGLSLPILFGIFYSRLKEKNNLVKRSGILIGL